MNQVSETKLSEIARSFIQERDDTDDALYLFPGGG